MAVHEQASILDVTKKIQPDYISFHFLICQGRAKISNYNMNTLHLLQILARFLTLTSFVFAG